MKLSLFQVDAFSQKVFKGNPAAVVPLDKWIDAAVMQSIAAENNLSETAFFVPTKIGFEIRWFTPVAEVSLCGHATLAAAHVIFKEGSYPKKELSFGSRSGKLHVCLDNDYLQLDFPADQLSPEPVPTKIVRGMGVTPEDCFRGKSDYLLVYSNQQIIKRLRPDFKLLAKVGSRGIIATAPGDKVDFVSRFFAPGIGVNENPVTGSAPASLVPYWTQRLKKKEFTAHQLSARGGVVQYALKDGRVQIAGRAITYLRGTIEI